MSHIEVYKLVETVDDKTKLEKEVNNLLALGWELHDATQVSLLPYRNSYDREVYHTVYRQAMVKLKEEERL